ncbi:RagB/SusD family nutrient uptake outer membrane protein [Pedobacter immunditicola]|uniref:RagB/SusD family nutrient uptake outer membrane protein n=1 Tax=Pedobacter immunditicola TaxID=3133440 RepID=UPI0030B44135
MKTTVLRKNFIILICISLFLLVSCKKDYLERTPSDFISVDEVFNNINNAEAFLNNAYNTLPNFQEFTDYGGRYNLGGGTDEMRFHGYNARTPYDFNNGNWNAVSFPMQQKWADFYGTIRRLNMFLANFNSIPEEVNSGSSSERKKRMEGEAYGLRAYYYFQLFKMWGGVPIVDELLDPNSGEEFLLKRNTEEEVIAFIKSDIAKAVAILPEKHEDDSNYGRVTANGCRALLSEVSLFFASPLWNQASDNTRWQVAAKDAKEALDLAISSGHILSKGTVSGKQGYERIFLEMTNSEVIWARQDPGGTESHLLDFYNGTQGTNGWYANGVLQEMVDSYEMTNGEIAVLGYDENNNQIINPAANYNPNNPYANRDPRFYQSVIFPFSGWKGNTMDIRPGGKEDISNGVVRANYWVKKYTLESHNLYTGSGNAPRRFTIFRVAELYLNFAEAQNEAVGPDQSVYDAVNAIRSRVGMPNLPAGLSQAAMRSRIRNERKVELAFEGSRFWDVRRWKIAEIVDNGPVHRVVTDANLNFSYPVVQTRVFDKNKHYLFPIPQIEIDKNPNMVQNPGW